MQQDFISINIKQMKLSNVMFRDTFTCKGKECKEDAVMVSPTFIMVVSSGK